MTDIKLSICIPTHNFGDFIGDTLKTIVSQLRDDVDIHILDGGSTDNTSTIVANWQRHCPAIHYHQQAFRGGIDRDIARVVEVSRGEYFWLFSADDLMLDGAIARVLNEIDGAIDVYLCAHEEREFDLSPRCERHPSFMLECDREFHLTDPSDRRNYFVSAFTTSAFFSYLSSLIVRRATWNIADLDDRFVGSCWAHAHRLLTLMNKNMRLKYISRPLVAWRADNDSFGSDGIVRRCALAIEGYNRIANTVFGSESMEALHIRRVLANEYSLGYYLLAKHQLASATVEDRKRLDQLVAVTFSDPSRENNLRKFIYKVSPAAFSPLILAAWKSTRLWIKPLINKTRRKTAPVN